MTTPSEVRPGERVLYMSRATAREMCLSISGVEPQLRDGIWLRFGLGQIEVLFDDRMELGAARLEKAP